MRLNVLFVAFALGLAGCASYLTPGAAVSVAEIAEPDIGEVLSRAPAAAFPARLIVARVQGPGYVSYTNRGYGQGAYTVLTARDIETEEDFERVSAMPGVVAVGQLSRVVLPGELKSLRDLRAAAAQLRGDIILLYTVDTTFRTDTRRLGPLQAVGLGFFPNKKARVSSTCAIAFIDVRTGYVYGVAEASAAADQRSNLWNTQSAIEEARVEAERSAFVGALSEGEAAWRAIVAEHSRGAR